MLSSSRNTVAVGVIATLLLSGVGSALFEIPAINAKYKACYDGIDNDEDGTTDYPEDSDCDSIDDDVEGPAAPGLFVEVQDGVSEAKPGQSLTYVISLRQQRSSSQFVDVAFYLPPHVDFSSASEAGRFTGSEVRWKNVGVFQNSKKTLTVQGRVKDSVSKSTLLVARASAAGQQAQDTTLVTEQNVLPTNALSLLITDQKEWVEPGELVNYVVRARNTSSRSVQTDIRVAVPEQGQLVNASVGAQKSRDRVVWNNVRLEPNETKSFTVAVRLYDNRLPQGYLLRARAWAGAIQAIDTTRVLSQPLSPKLSLSISNPEMASRRGDLITYNVTVRNQTPYTGTNESVSAKLPTYTEFVSATEGGVRDGRLVRWNSLRIAPWGVRQLTYTVRVSSDAPAGDLVASAHTNSAGQNYDKTYIGGVYVANSSPVSQKTTSTSSSSVPKKQQLFSNWADRSEVLPGGQIRFTLRVQNTTQKTLRDLSISDRFDPSLLRVVSQLPSPADQDNGHIRWHVPVLMPGDVWEVTYVLGVADTVPHGATLSTIATLEGNMVAYLSLEDRVQVVKVRVLAHLPQTGVGLDMLFTMLSTGVLGLGALGQKRLLI